MLLYDNVSCSYELYMLLLKQFYPKMFNFLSHYATKTVTQKAVNELYIGVAGFR